MFYWANLKTLDEALQQTINEEDVNNIVKIQIGKLKDPAEISKEIDKKLVSAKAIYRVL